MNLNMYFIYYRISQLRDFNELVAFLGHFSICCSSFRQKVDVQDNKSTKRIVKHMYFNYSRPILSIMQSTLILNWVRYYTYQKTIIDSLLLLLLLFVVICYIFTRYISFRSILFFRRINQCGDQKLLVVHIIICCRTNQYNSGISIISQEENYNPV